MIRERSTQSCIYCGNRVGRVKKGEHIIPKAIGGARTIKNVCDRCNNHFSVLDTELCSRSSLSIVASQQIKSHIWQAWDVDVAADNLLIEGRPEWPTKSFLTYPQIIFEQAGPHIRGDYVEMIQFGREDFERVLTKSALLAYRRHEAGEKRCLHFERIEPNPAPNDGYRLPPRMFWRHSISELASRLARNRPAAFVLRYITEAERRFALNCLDNWSGTQRFREFVVQLGTSLPSLRCFYDCAKVLRALAKIAINVLAAYCPNTPIDNRHFGDVIKVIIGKTPVSSRLIRANGFVCASDIQPIRDSNGGHSFRLLHMKGHWMIYMSFFGGRIGAFVRFPGPNNEQWCSANIVAPLHSGEWTFTLSPILQPLIVRTEWEDQAKIMPSVEMRNVSTEIRVSHVPKAEA